MLQISLGGYGASIMNVIVVVWLVLGLVIGFWLGFLDRNIKVVEMFLVVLLSILLKNPVSTLLYKNLPFFNFKIQVLNILLYELIAFILLVIIFVVILILVNKLINFVESFFSFILNIGFPSKILGAVLGFIEGAFYLYIFVFVVILMSIFNNSPLEYSFANKFFDNAPVFNVTFGPSFEALLDITSVSMKNTDKDVVDSKSLDILLRNKIISKENALQLVDSGKLKIKDAKDIINKY